MLAVVELGWNQFTVRTGDIIDVKKLKNAEATQTIEAMLIADEEGENVKVWTPFVSGSKVEFKLIEESFKWEKVRVFKMKSKKRYARNRWFRAHLTKLEVLNIA